MQKIPFTDIRESITQYVRFATSSFRPFFSAEIHALELERYRSRHDDITYTPLLMKIIAAAARKYPLMNAIRSRGFLKDTIVIPDEVDICFAMEKTYRGETFVAIPIIRAVETKSIGAISSEIAMLSRLPYEEMPGIDLVFRFHRLPHRLKYGMHRRTLERPLERQGLSYRALMESVQSQMACQLLLDTEMQVQYVAEALHFSSAANFATAFRRWTGVTPSDYRRGSG